MAHGKRCMAFLYTPVSIRKAKRKAFLVLGCGTWEYLATQKVTYNVMPPINMDSSSFADHHKEIWWIAPYICVLASFPGMEEGEEKECLVHTVCACA